MPLPGTRQDVVGAFRAVSSTHNAVVVFRDTQPKPMYSYCIVSEDGADTISEVREKVKISDWANTGCYSFASGAELAAECEAMISAGATQLSQDQVRARARVRGRGGGGRARASPSSLIS